jgi:hypothetical protein
MESFRDDDKLVAALGSLRTQPSMAFAAELDERVAAGFPRRASADGESPLVRLGERLRAMKPRQVLLPSMATAVVAVVVATAVVSVEQSDNQGGSATHPRHGSAAAAGHRGGGELLSEFQGASAGSADAGEEVAAPKAAPAFDDAARSTPAQLRSAQLQPFSPATHRNIEHSAEMTLGTDPEGVSDAAAQVFDAVHAAHGVVLRSSINSGSSGAAGAHFELLIPSGHLDDALAAFSGIAEVRSRNDGTTDITAPTVGASERLQDSQARVDSLLKELAGSETETEREAIEAQLHSERRKSARLSAQLTALQKRASLSHVSLRIVTGGSHSGSGGGSWDVGNALGDAGQILAVAAGVTIVGLAILGPLALIALLIWAANRAWVRRGRERALG